MAVILSTAINIIIILSVILTSISSVVYPPDNEFNRGSQTVTDGAYILLKPNEQYLKNDSEEFKILCYPSISKTLLQIWRSVHLTFENGPLSYEIFPGVNATDVLNKKNSKSIWHPSSWLSGQKTSVDFPAFSPYCIGIVTKERYGIHLKVRTINYWRVLQTIVGVLLLLSAPSLSRNPFFHYTSGVSLGVIASLLVLIYVLSRFMPKKSASYAILVFGYSFILYVLQLLWQDLNEIIANYMDIFLAYCLCTAFISFLICYRMGPVQNVRTFNIIQWCMQIIATVLIYLSSEYREVSTAIVLMLLSFLVVPSSWIARGKRIWYRLFPPKVKLLSELEYIEQGHIETRKALEELRKYCSSPDCNVWKTVTKLKSPNRFAAFIETGNHCTDEELLRYNTESYYDSESCDEEDDIEEDTETEYRYSPRLSNGYQRQSMS